MAQVLQIHFDRGGDDIRPTVEIPIETRSKRRCLATTVSASSECHTISSKASSRRVSTIRRGTSKGETLVEDLLLI